MLKKAPLIFVLGLVFSLLYSCRKKDGNLNLDVYPEEDILNAHFVDTSSILCFTAFEDSLRSDEATDYALLGSVMDPVFGRTDASIYTNFVMPNNIVNAGFGGPSTLDSVVLSLVYYSTFPNYYGDKTDALKLNIYELNQQMYYDSSYYSRRKLSYTNSDIVYGGAGLQFTPNFTDSVNVGGVKYKPMLRVRLNDAFGNSFLNDTTKLASTAALQSSFKGLLMSTQSTITLSPEYGSLVYFRLTDALTKITFYYKNNSNPTVQKTFDLPIGSSAARYNQFDHDKQFLSYAPLASQLYAPDTINNVYGNQNLFLQGVAGTRLKMYFPNLTHYADTSPVTVNKAELVLKVDNASLFLDNSKYFYPSRLTMYGIDNNYKPVFLLDQFGFESTSFGGNYDPINKEYRFNLSRTISGLINGTGYVKGLLIVMHQSQINPSRVVLGGAKNSTYPIKLKLWLTPLHKN